MSKALCPFGPLFRKKREARQISLWQVCLALQYHLRNIQRIEAGQHEPSVELALRMVMAINEAPGDFFCELANQLELLYFASPSARDSRLTPEQLLLIESNEASFGSLLKYVRLKHGLPQRALVEATGYNLRNLSNVENGRQNPGVITALRLVCASGCDVAWFYSTYVHIAK